jgi:hypothetical protein
MAALALEINDAGLLALREGAPRPDPESPGVALFEGGAVLMGAAAAARARLRPRAVHDAFWDSLDTEPLGRPFPAGVRRADLAHAHLLALRQGWPEPPREVFLAVPGFWSNERLGLLLSVARAAGLPVVGLVDAAVAAASFAGRGQGFIHLDLTRHRSVVTAFGGGAEVERRAVFDVPGLGRRAFEERLAQEIARRFVAQTRFDPLHSAASEQALHDALPVWLAELRAEETCPAVLTAGGREHRLVLERSDVLAWLTELRRQLTREVMARKEEDTGLLLVSARAARLPGLLESLRADTGHEVLALPHDIAVSATLRQRDLLRRAGEALAFVTRLPRRAGELASPMGGRA